MERFPDNERVKQDWALSLEIHISSSNPVCDVHLLIRRHTTLVIL